MTNHLVGEVYAKIIEEVVDASRADFEENGVGQQTLAELQREWQSKLSQRNVAQMPWDPKPAPPPPAQSQPSNVSSNTNGISPPNYGGYENVPQAANGQTRVKTEPNDQYNLPPLSAYQQAGGPQGGAARAAQLMQQNYGQQAAASLNAMQSRGLALPGQQTKPQGLQLPQGGQHQQQQQQQQQMTPQQYAEAQRRQAAMQAQQLHQRQQQQQQQQAGIKVESTSPTLDQGGFQPQPNYAQTDGADDDLAAWRAMLAQRRAAHAEQGRQADRMIGEHVQQLSAELRSGLMVPLDDLPSGTRQPRMANLSTASGSMQPSIAQFDGPLDDEDDKSNIKDEEDEDAINSDLDDPDDDPIGGADEEDEFIDTILCTYDKVQRVKNKWKCTLKDGVLNTNKKEYLFHKAQGEFEW